MLILLILLGSVVHSDEIHELRVRKAHIIVDTLYPNSGFSPYCGYLITKHEARGDKEFSAAYWWSLVYGAANFSLQVGGVAPGNCAGPLDVKHYPLILDPQRNISYHVSEMWLGYTKGYRGIDLCKYVMLPSAPRDWGNHIFYRTDLKHKRVIQYAYKSGKLP